MIGRTSVIGLDRFAGETHCACPGVEHNRSPRPRLLSYHAATDRSNCASCNISTMHWRRPRSVAAPPLHALPEVSELRSAAEQFVDALDTNEKQPSMKELDILQHKLDTARQQVDGLQRNVCHSNLWAIYVSYLQLEIGSITGVLTLDCWAACVPSH